ncbi:MAG: HlyD family type I secretion periplasmic adaptor subunit, partial [Alphaproteobacteria bacterium]
MPPSNSLTLDQQRFAPALCEVAEAAPNRLLLLLPAILATGVLLLLLWGVVGRIDMVAQAQGRVLPTARVQVIQPALDAGAGGGIIRAIHVRTGDRVAAGAALIDLDTTETRADQERLELRHLTQRVEQAVLLAALGTTDADLTTDPLLRLALPADTPSDLARARRDQLAREWDSVQSRLQIADREIERLDASRAATAAQLARVRQVLPLLGERVRARETLVAQQSMARSTWLELRQELAEREGEAAVLTQQLRQADVDSALARDRRRQILVERAESLRTKLTEVERSLQDTTTDLVRAQQRQARRTLTAPVAGTVADLRVHTIGGVARDGDALLRIVPETSSLEVEAKILNRDVGHIRVG